MRYTNHATDGGIKILPDGKLNDGTLGPVTLARLAETAAQIRDATNGNYCVLLVTQAEKRAIVSGLRKLKTVIGVDMRKQARRGWKPEPGKLDNNVIRMKRVDALLARYGAGE